MIERIVVGVDGSANAHAALTWAVDLAGAVGAEVIVVHGIGLREAAAFRDERDRALLERELAEVWSAPLVGSGIHHRRLLVDGDPVTALLRTAQDARADLVVVGCRGVGDRAELLLGSTSAQVTQRSPVPVVVVPRPSSTR
jgi:nucleotide-binding universal stress UspA family protein